MTDALAQLPAHQVSLWIRARPAIGNLIEYIVLLPARVRRHRSVFLAHLSFPQMIQAKISHDAVNPGVKGAFKAKIADALVGLQEGSLLSFPGFMIRAGEVNREPEHGLVVVPHQFLEGSAIAALRFADQ